jgi:hypothetical protein
MNKKWTKEGSNIMVFDDTEWVAWMDDAMKKYRSESYDSYNFAGTTDWAVDLQEFKEQVNHPLKPLVQLPIPSVEVGSLGTPMATKVTRIRAIGLTATASTVH